MDRTILTNELIPLMMPYIRIEFGIDLPFVDRNDSQLLQIVNDILKNVIDNEEKRISGHNTQFLEMYQLDNIQNDSQRSVSITNSHVARYDISNRRCFNPPDANPKPRKTARPEYSQPEITNNTRSMIYTQRRSLRQHAHPPAYSQDQPPVNLR
jgi:hypothetical protein